MAREPLSFSEDALEQAQERQRALFEGDPLLPRSYSQQQALLRPDLSGDTSDLSFPEDPSIEAEQEAFEEDFGTAQFPSEARYAGRDGAAPERAPEPEEETELPFGEYDPADIRVQYLHRIGRPDGNFAGMVLERFSSGDAEPTSQEVFNAADDAARAVAGDLGISTRSNEGKLQVQELTEAFSRMYREQKQIMNDRGLLTAGEAATDSDATTEDRVKAGLAEISVGGPDTYETYERILTAQGEFDDDMTPEQRDSKVAEMILRDLKDVKVPAADLKRLRNQLYAGEWGELRGERMGPPMPSAQQLQEAQEADEEPAALQRFLGGMFGGGDEEEEPSEPPEPNAPEIVPDDPGGIPTGNRPENPWADRALAAQQERFGLGPELPLPEVGIDWMTPERQREIRRTSPGFATNLRAAAIQMQQAVAGVPLSDALRGVEDLAESALILNRDVAQPRIEREILSLQEQLRSGEVGSGGAAALNERLTTLRGQLQTLRESGGLTDEEAKANFDQVIEDTAERINDALPRVLELSAQLREAPASPETEEMFQSFDDSFIAGISDFAASPLQITADLVTRNAGQIGAALGVGTAGALIGQPEAGIAAGAAVGGMTEQSLSVVQDVEQWLRDNEVDVSDPEAVREALEADPDGLQGVLSDSIRRATIITIGGLAAAPVGRAIAAGAGPASTAGREAIEAASEGAVELVAGGTPADAFVEAVAGGATSAAVDAPGQTVGALERVQQGGEAEADALETAQEEAAEAPAPEEPALDEQAPTERDVDEEPTVRDPSAIDDLMSRIMAPVERGGVDVESQREFQSDLEALPPTPQQIEQTPSEEIVRAVSERDERREEVREAALPEADIPAEAMTRVEAEAGSVAPSPEEVEVAAATSSEIAALQAQVDEGTRTLTKNDRNALAVLTNGSDEILAAADRVVLEARQAMTDALGADIDAPVRVTGAARDNVEGARQRGNRQRTRAAIERRNRDQAANTLAKLRSMGQGEQAPDASLIGAMAGLPRGVLPTLTGSSAEVTDATDPIGSYMFRNDLALPSRASSATQQAEALAGTLEALDRHQQMLQNLAITSLTDPDSDTATALARRISQGRVAEAEPLRQLLRTRVFRGQDAGLLDQISIVSLASATDEQLRRWSTARGPADIEDLDTALGVRDQILPSRSDEGRRVLGIEGESARTTARRDADLALIRGAARVVENVRSAERKTARARDAITRALVVLSAVSDIDQSGTDLAGFIQGVRSATQQGVPDAVALRESLRRNAPNLAEREGIQPLKELITQIGIANSQLPVDLRVNRDVLARAYENTLTNEQLFGENWRARRLVRKLDQTSVAKTVEQITALEPTSDPLEIQAAREELGAMAVAEQLLRQARLPELRALRDDAETQREEARILDQIAEVQEMDSEALGEMLINEFGLDEDAAAGVVIRGQEMATAAQGDPDAIKAVSEGADELLIGVHLYEGRIDADFVGVDPEGEGIAGLPTNDRFTDPDIDNVASDLREKGLKREGTIAFPHSREMNRVAVMMSNVARDLKFKRGSVLFPLQDYTQADVDVILATFPEADRDSVLTALAFSALTARNNDAMNAQSDRRETPGGFMMPTSRGNLVFVDPDVSVGQMAAIAAHEMGHAMTVDLVSSAVERSPKTADMLYRAYRESPYGATPERAGFFPRGPRDEEAPPDGDHIAYMNKFDEWFASQVGEYIINRPARPTGLVARLIDSIAQVWRRIQNMLVPPDTISMDNVRLSQLAVSNLVENHVRHALGAFHDPAGNLVDLRNQDWRDRAGIPIRKIGEEETTRSLEASLDPFEQTPFDPGDIPFTRVLMARRPPNAPGQRLSQTDQQEILTEFAGLTAESGTMIRFVDPDRMSVRDKNILGDLDVGYRSPSSPGAPAVVLVNTGKVTGTAQGVKAIRRALVVNQGLDAIIGRSSVDQLKAALINPRQADLGRVSRAGQQRLTKLRNQVTRDLTSNQGDKPAVADVADEMLRRLTDEALEGRSEDLDLTAGRELRNALIGGGRTPYDDKHIRELLILASDPEATMQSPFHPKTVSEGREYLAKLNAETRSRNIRKRRAVRAVDETPGQALYRNLFDYQMPLRLIQRAGEAMGNSALARAARNVDQRLRQYQAHLDRVWAAQRDSHEGIEDQFGRFASELGIKKVNDARSMVSGFMYARAAIELNESHALVYGEVENEALEEQRLAIISQADELVSEEQGDNRNRDAESFERVRQIRRDQMAQLRDLLVGPNAPDNPIKDYVEKSRQGARIPQSKDWMNISGFPTDRALSIIHDLESVFSNRFINTFMESGLDGRLRRLIDQTFENRVLSGTYGASGELYISRLGIDHFVPMQGGGIPVGRIVREDEHGQLIDDPISKATGVRSVYSQLAPSKSLRYFRDTMPSLDVLQEASSAYFSSIREMTTNHINGGVVALARAMQSAGIAQEQPGDRQPIVVSEPEPFLVWYDPADGKRYPMQDGEATRLRMQNPDIVYARQTMNEDGKTGSILHALPSGDYLVVQINDETLYQAVMHRFMPITLNPVAKTVLSAIGEFTRIRARTFTSWDPVIYTTLRATTRDSQEAVVAAVSEHGVPMRRAASIIPRAARMVPQLHKFFHGDQEVRDEMLSNPPEGFASFARRWRSGRVQTFAQQLELLTDESRLLAAAPNLQDDTLRGENPAVEFIRGVGEAAANNPVTRYAEAHADVMENSIRQAFIDVVADHYVREEGITRTEAEDRATEAAISLLDFTQRSALGEFLAPIQPFAQTALTGTDALLDRRIWRGGQPPAELGGGVTDEGQVQSRIWTVENIPTIMRNINFSTIGGLFVAGYMDVLLASITMGSTAALVSSAIGPDDDDDEVPEDEEQKIRSKYVGPTVEAEAASWLKRNADPILQKYVHRDASLDNLDELRPTSVMTRWLMPYGNERGQATAPVSYGIVSIASNMGKAAALIQLGQDPSRVAGAYLNTTIRDLTPFDAPYSDNVGGAAGLIMSLMPETLTFVEEQLTGVTDEGIRLGNTAAFPLGPADEGPTQAPRASQSPFLQEMLQIAGQNVEQLPFVGGAALRDWIPGGARAESFVTNVPFFGSYMRNAIEEMERTMTENMAAKEPVYSVQDGLGDAGVTIMRGAGFLNRDPARNNRLQYYDLLRWEGWKNVARWEEDMGSLAARGLTYENTDFVDVRKAVSSLQGLFSQYEGKFKRERQDLARQIMAADNPEDRDRYAEELLQAEDRQEARYKLAVEVLQNMKNTVDMGAPRTVPLD